MDKPRGKRRSIRLGYYDYSLPGAYFLTICSAGYKHAFGRMRDDQVSLSRIGQLAQQNLITMTEQAVHLELDYYVVMPNHLHAIIWILQLPEPDSIRAKQGFAPTQDSASRLGPASPRRYALI